MSAIEAPPPNLEIFGHSEAGDLQDRREHIEVRDDSFDSCSRRDHSGPAHQERDPDRVIEHVGPETFFTFHQPRGVAFVPEPVLADHVTVVAREDDDRSRGEPPFVELRQQPPDVAVDRADAGVILTIELLDALPGKPRNVRDRRVERAVRGRIRSGTGA